MAWDLAAAGTVCIDDVTTPSGRAVAQLGGSAVYFSLAASRHTTVRVIGVVGEDGVEKMREVMGGTTVDLEGLEVVGLPTRRWYAVHDFARWVTATERSDEGASAGWTPRLTGAAQRAPVLFLGSMAPRQQHALLEASSARLVAADSMVVHIGDDPDHVWRVVEGSDLLFLNRAELATLTGQAEGRWAGSARALLGRGRLRAVIVKAGPLGAAVVTAAGVTEREAHPVEAVIDPTGAGDALAGGFLGACAEAERSDIAYLDTALVAGLRCAADAISRFGTAGLRARR